MTNVEKQNLEDFLLDIECLNQLNPWLDNQNIFEILKLSRMEIRHSNFLAWIFNPNEKHTFGDKILKDVISSIILKNKSLCNANGFEIIDAMLWDYSSFIVYREKEHIDLAIVSNKEKRILCFENKIFASEHNNQLQRYMKNINDHYPDYSIIFVYLTPDGEDASDTENWISFSYKDLINILEENLKKLILTTEEKVYIENYIKTIRRHIMKDERLSKICSTIYYKHRAALDLIYENKPDVAYALYESLVKRCEMLNENGAIVFSPNSSSKSYIRFNTNFILGLLPKFTEGRLSSWGTEFMCYYEIVNKNNTLMLQFAMNNKGLNSEEILRCDSICKAIDPSKPLKSGWLYKAFSLSKKVLPNHIDLSEISEEDFENKKEEILDYIFNDISKSIKIFEAKLTK